MNLCEITIRLMHFKRWANQITFQTVMALPDRDAFRPMKTRFGNMVHTLNHVYVVDDIFRAHMEGQPHSYTARNTDETPVLADLLALQQKMDDWWIRHAEDMNEAALGEIITFEFVGGGVGGMSRADIFMHIVNHGNYHRGFVGDMLYQVGVTPPATDYPVFLRDVART